jgi:hypothetical protein
MFVNRKAPAWRRRRLPAIHGRVAGYEDADGAERLARDLAMRANVGWKGLDRPAASTCQMGQFETGWLATEALQERLGHLLTRPVGRPPRKPLVSHAGLTYRAQGWAKPLAVGEQAAIGVNLRLVGLELEPVAEGDPERLLLGFTRRIRHARPTRLSFRSL